MSTEDDCKLFVAGLSDALTEQDVRHIFEALDVRVEHVSVPRDRATGRPRGFGFVTLASPEEAEKARNELDGSVQAGKTLSVRAFHAEPPSKKEGYAKHDRGPRDDADRTLYVGNLPYDCTEEELRELIAGQGDIERVSLPLDATGRPRGFGFVTLSSPEQARNVMDVLGGTSLRGRPLVVNPARGKDGGGGGGNGSRQSSRRHVSRDVREVDPLQVMDQVPDIPPRKTFDGRRRSSGRQQKEYYDDRPRRGGKRNRRSRRSNQWYDEYMDDDE